MDDILLNRYFISTYRLEKLRAKDAPSMIIDNEIDLQTKRLNALIKSDPKAEEYLNSTECQIEYLEFCAKEEHDDLSLNKCQSCRKYVLEGEYKCELHEELIHECKDFDPTGKNIHERCILMIQRCSKCSKAKIEDLIECSLNRNQLSEYCRDFSEN